MDFNEFCNSPSFQERFFFPNSPRNSNYKIHPVPTYNLSFLFVTSATDPLLKLVSLTFPYFHNPYATSRRTITTWRKREREREIRKKYEKYKKTQSSSMHICNPCHLPFNNIREPCLLVFNTATSSSSPIQLIIAKRVTPSSSRTILVQFLLS